MLKCLFFEDGVLIDNTIKDSLWNGLFSKVIPYGPLVKYIQSCLPKNTVLIIPKSDGNINKNKDNKWHDVDWEKEIQPYINYAKEKNKIFILGTLCQTDVEKDINYLYLPLDDEFFEHGIDFNKQVIPWEDKKSDLCWRGGCSGVGGLESIRVRFVDKIFKNNPNTNIRLSNWWSENKNIPNEYFAERIDFSEFFKYKIFFIVDGNVIASNHMYGFATGSIPFLISNGICWFSHLIIPYVHYIPVNYDLSNLLEQIEWVKNNDDKAKIIADNALIFSKEYFSSEYQKKYIKESIEKICKNSIENNSIKIIDCFTFYNELDLLNYRLSILDDYVDYFIIVEATHTHVGNVKELYYEKNKEKFSKFSKKIINIIVDDFKYIQPNIDISKNQQWNNENHQRNCISRGLDKLKLNDNDIIIISDLDEIPDYQTLLKIKNNEIKITLNSLEQDFYYYNLNTKSNNWYASKCISYEKYKELNLSSEQIRQYKCNTIENGGWHLSYFGDSKFIQNKIKNFGHQEFNDSNITNIDNIEEKKNNSTDLFNRSYVKWNDILIYNNKYLPPKYDIYLTNFYKYKIAKHITFFYSESRNINIEKYINKLIKAANSYKHKTDIFIHTNTKIDFSNRLEKNATGITKIIYHDITNEDPWKLPWKCRDLLKLQQNDYDIFISLEDDILIRKESLKYWLKYKDIVMKYNYNLGFFAVEVTDENIQVATNIAERKDGSDEQYLSREIFLGDKRYILNDKNPYCCSWIYDQNEFKKFVNSEFYNINNIRGYGIAESSSIGLHGLETNWYKGTIIPFDGEYLHEGSKLFHLPNKYWNLPNHPWRNIPFTDIVKL
jgi:beta-1,4-mannosyl-glycoprotein beta-1,4-N-acetylglucosaminyltransferase